MRRRHLHSARSARGVFCPLLIAVALCFGPRVAEAQTTDRGQPVAPGKELQLGADVNQTVGLPRGPALTGAELERRTEALSSRMRCPVCQGNAISDSPSEAARNMKSQVRAMIAAGYDDDQIFHYFESSYGEFIRLMPRAEGFNLLVWVVPLVALLLGFGAVVLMVRRRSGDDAGAAETRSAKAGEAPSTAGEADGADAAPDQTAPAEAALDPWIAKVREEVERKDG